VTPWGAVQMAAWDWRANFFPVGIAHSISRQPAELAALLIRRRPRAAGAPGRDAEGRMRRENFALDADD
jgi:hypothetical protein